jgi:hypothetical protein
MTKEIKYVYYHIRHSGEVGKGVIVNKENHIHVSGSEIVTIESISEKPDIVYVHFKDVYKNLEELLEGIRNWLR